MGKGVGSRGLLWRGARPLCPLSRSGGGALTQAVRGTGEVGRSWLEVGGKADRWAQLASSGNELGCAMLGQKRAKAERQAVGRARVLVALGSCG
jgi:hypothetical protein